MLDPRGANVEIKICRKEKKKADNDEFLKFKPLECRDVTCLYFRFYENFKVYNRKCDRHHECNPDKR